MLGQTLTATLLGATAVPIRVETYIAHGIPSFLIVGLPDSAVKESHVRIEAALLTLTDKLKQSRVRLNLAPADVRKEGTGLDLAMALATLAALGEIAPEHLIGYMFVGELGLDGAVRGVPGTVVYARLAREAGVKALILPVENLQEAQLVRGLRLLGVSSITHAAQALAGSAAFVEPPDAPPPQVPDVSGCFSEVSGQAVAKRALLIAAVGGHHVLLSGPPGVGKTMLCERFVGLLPHLSDNEQLEVMALHSLVEPARMSRRPPLRAPHHTASTIALIGGGNPPRPGEISLAHRGVLFLDELGEFRAEAVNALRQPLESGRVSIARAMRRVSYDAQFQLLAATNPCPCGNAGHPARRCTCSTSALDRYRARLTGPIVDRIDLYVPVTGRISTQEGSPTSATLRARVIAARAFAVESRGQVVSNSELRGALVRPALTPQAERLMLQAQTTLFLSGRALDRTLRVARSIADLAHAPDIDEASLSEALAYRKESTPHIATDVAAQPFSQQGAD